MFSFIFNSMLKILKGGVSLNDMYLALIINHRRIINQVPVQFRDSVMADLTALGLDGNGNLIVVA